jgi:hypothetical protein
LYQAATILCVDTSAHRNVAATARLQRLCGPDRIFRHDDAGHSLLVHALQEQGAPPEIVLDAEVPEDAAFRWSDAVPVSIAITNNAPDKTLPANMKISISDFQSAAQCECCVLCVCSPGWLFCCSKPTLILLLGRGPHFLPNHTTVARELNPGERVVVLPIVVFPRPGVGIDTLPSALLVELFRPDGTSLFRHKLSLRTDWFVPNLKPQRQSFPFRVLNLMLLGHVSPLRCSRTWLRLAGLEPLFGLAGLQIGSGKSQLGNSMLTSLAHEDFALSRLVAGSSGDTSSMTAGLIKTEAAVDADFAFSVWDTEGMEDQSAPDGRHTYYQPEALRCFLNGSVPHGHQGANLAALQPLLQQQAEKKRFEQEESRSLWARMFEPAPALCAQLQEAAHVVIVVLKYSAVSCVFETNTQVRVSLFVAVFDVRLSALRSAKPLWRRSSPRSTQCAVRFAATRSWSSRTWTRWPRCTTRRSCAM